MKDIIIASSAGFLVGFITSWIFKTKLVADLTSLEARVAVVEGKVTAAASAVALDVKKV